jgi:hypothetical protein
MRRPGALALLGALLVATAAPDPAAAESALWSLTATPSAVATGVATSFSMQATNDDPLAAAISSSEIGCLWVDVPASFSVAGASVTGSSAGDAWSAMVNGNRVRVWTSSGGDRLEAFDWVRFTVVATAWSTGSVAWNARAFRQQDCTGAGSLLTLPPVVLVSGPAVTPSPTPSPTPTPAAPTPTPAGEPPPTPAATRSPTGAHAPPSAAPSEPVPDSTPFPTEAASPGPAASGADSDAGSPRTPVRPAADVPSDASTSGGVGMGGGAGATSRSLALDMARLEVGGPGIGVLQGIDVWIVPAASMAVPGLLILIWIALQALGVLAWLPAVRRLRGDEPEPPA